MLLYFCEKKGDVDDDANDERDSDGGRVVVVVGVVEVLE